MAVTVLHIIPSSESLGAEKQLGLLAQGLSEKGFDARICVLDQGASCAKELLAAGVSVHRISKRWRFDPLAFAQLLRHMRQVRPTLVHTWLQAGDMYGRWAARAAGVPHVVAAADIAKAVIDNGVPKARPSNVSRADLLRELDLPSDARLVGVVGRHVPEKRTTDLIWAADLLRVLHNNMRLLVIGDGTERPQLERFARLASDLNHIRFLGQRTDVWRIMPHLDMMWHASATDQQPNAIMEAMAAAVPVVASNTAGHRDLVVQGKTGYLIPIAARAARVRLTDKILSDTELAQRLGTAAQERMTTHFGIEKMVQNYADLYHRELASRRRQPPVH